MGRSGAPKAENHERGAFQKLTAGLRHAIEGATEVGAHRDQPMWNNVAIALQKTLHLVNQLQISKDGNAALDLRHMIEKGSG